MPSEVEKVSLVCEQCGLLDMTSRDLFNKVVLYCPRKECYGTYAEHLPLRS